MADGVDLLGQMRLGVVAEHRCGKMTERADVDVQVLLQIRRHIALLLEEVRVERAGACLHEDDEVVEVADRRGPGLAEGPAEVDEGVTVVRECPSR